MFWRAGLVLIASACLLQVQANECVDDNAQIAALGQQQGRDDMNGCIDVADGCDVQNHLGDSLREICCLTCSDYDPNRPAVPTQLPLPNRKVQLFLLGGQSECTGQAGVGELEADSQGYPELQGEIPGVWFAGYASPASADRFFIAPLKAGRDRSMFGPEVSFGERIFAVTGQPTMMVKFCSGGTNVHAHWNPFNKRNLWDTTADDGTAQWLYDNGELDFSTKKTQFKNMIYTIRRTQEALKSAGIPYEWAGILWVQGQADLKTGEDPIFWKTFGENTARVWDGFRRNIGRGVPIIDTGANVHNQLKSGKEYAAQIVKGCKAKNVEFALASNDDTSVDCVPSSSNPCYNASNVHWNIGPFLFYGYDPSFPQELRNCGDNCKEFEWYRQYPYNLHSGYEGMILKGRMLANAYIRDFTSYKLPSTYLHSDPAALYPWNRCEDGTRPSAFNYCWMDYRNPSFMSTELCTYVNNIIMDDNHGPYDEDNISTGGGGSSGGNSGGGGSNGGNSGSSGSNGGNSGGSGGNSGSNGGSTTGSTTPPTFEDDDGEDDDDRYGDNIFQNGGGFGGGGQHGGLSDTSAASIFCKTFGMGIMFLFHFLYIIW